MDNQQVIQNYDDEIDIREILTILWDKKVIILALTLIGSILAGIISLFVLSPVYDTKLNIVISIPEIYNTRYGEYKLPITSNDQYIDLITSNDVILGTIKEIGKSTEDISVESLKSRISIEKATAKAGEVQNSFNVIVSADNPNKSLEIATTLYNRYIEFLDAMTKERAIIYYYNNFTVKLKAQELLLKSTQEVLKKNEELLAKTPQTINQKEAMKEIQGQIPESKGFVVLENVINPNYTKVEGDIILNKQAIFAIEEDIRKYKEYTEQLDIEKQAVQKYYETGKGEKLQSNLIGVIETSVYLSSPPVAPSQKTSPRNLLNIAIGLVLGGMLGCLIALVKGYWFKKE